MATLQDWADTKLSAELGLIRARGESQEVEFMREFPTNTHELAKEIAAFATSNDATILIGIDDDGNLVGIDAFTSTQRDALVRRVEGIAHGPVRPSLTPSIRWAVEGEKVVMIIGIRKGSDPVYYTNNVPYLRHLRQSRPAQPNEVVELIKRFIEGEREHPLSRLAWSAATSICDIVELADAYPMRRLRPHRDSMIGQWEAASSRLRQAAATDEAKDSGWKEDLQALALALDRITTATPVVGDDPIAQLLPATTKMAEDLYKNRVMRIPIPGNTQEEAKKRARELSREYDDLVSRYPLGEFPKSLDVAQRDIGLISFYLLHLVWWDLRGLPENQVGPLHQAARDLGSIETMRTYGDGGESQAKVVERMHDVLPRLLAAAEALPRDK